MRIIDKLRALIDMWRYSNKRTKDFGKKHRCWYLTIIFSSILLVWITEGVWIYIAYLIGQMATEENAKNALYLVPFVIGMVGAGLIAVALDFILSSFFKKVVPNFPEEHLSKKRIAILIGSGIMVCAICAVAMYMIAT